MAVLIDDDFQSYAVAAVAPFGPYASGGSLVAIGVVPAQVINTPVGVFGDVKSLHTPAVQCLQFPSAPLLAGGTYYQQFTVYQAFQVATTNGTSENGVCLAFLNANQPFNQANIATLKILADGSLAFTNENQLAIFAASDFSLLVGQWYFFRVDISFSIIAGNFAYTCTWYVDGIARLSVTNQDTGIASAAYLANIYINAIVVGGCGGGSTVGRMTVYDSIQAPGFYPHPGSPAARVTQGVIELITSSVPGPPTPPFPPGPTPPGPPVPGPGGCAEQSKLSVLPGLSVAGTAPPSIPGQTDSLKSQL